MNFLYFLKNNSISTEAAGEFLISALYLKYNKKNNDLKEYAEIVLKRMDSNGLEKLNEFLDNTNFSIAEIIDEYYKLIMNNGYNNRLGYNRSLNELVYHLLDIKDGEKVLDLESGIGTFLFDIYKQAHLDGKILEYKGVERNGSHNLFARMIFELLDEKNDLISNDVLSIDTPDYDKAFVLPTLGNRYSEEYLSTTKEISNILNVYNSPEWFFVDKVIKGLKEGGKAIAFLPQNRMYNARDEKYRKYILEEGFVESIILLPGALIPFARSLVVFSCNNKDVNILDASNSYDIERLNVKLRIEEIKESLKDAVKFSNNEVLAKDMSVDKLLFKKEDVKYPTKITNVTKLFQGTQYTLKNFEGLVSVAKTNTRLLTPSNIESGLINWDSLCYIDDNLDKKFRKYKIEENDVIITSKGLSIKTTIVDQKLEEDIILTGGMICIRPNVEKISPYFLKMFLDSKKGQSYIESIQKKGIISTITLSNLETIDVSCPPLNIQEEVIEKYKESIKMYATLKRKVADLENEINTYFDEIENKL